MKQTSIAKLSEVYNNLNARYNGKSYTYDDKYMADLIKEVIRAEAMTPAKAGKFNIYNYTHDDFNLRPVMCGVFHYEGWQVASDLHIMLALKETYPEEYEHKILRKDGSFILGKYPDWRSIIPDGKDYEEYEFDAQKFYDWIEQKRTEWKAETGKGIKFAHEWRVQVGPAQLKAEFFYKLISGMKELGATKILIKDARRTVYAKTDKGIVLLMPVLADEKINATNVLKLA